MKFEENKSIGVKSPISLESLSLCENLVQTCLNICRLELFIV